MERCDDCNAVMKKDESVCLSCGAKASRRYAQAKKRSKFSRLVDFALYISLAFTAAAIFVPAKLLTVDLGLAMPPVSKCLMASVILIVIRSSAKEMTVR